MEHAMEHAMVLLMLSLMAYMMVQAMVQAMVSVYGAVKWVPMADSMDTAACEEVRASLQRVLEGVDRET